MNNFTLKYIVLLIAQILLWNYCNFTQFVTVAILPAMILLLPVRTSSPVAMLIAFASGFAADFLGAAPLGLTSLAIVPVALLRSTTIRMVFGSDEDELSFSSYGTPKMLLAVTIVTAEFLLVYIIADSAGTRALWIDFVKFIASLATSVIVSVPIARLICQDNSQKWK